MSIRSVFTKPGCLPAHGRSVVITGASTGLGRACALFMERCGFTVFASVRRAEDGERLVAESAFDQLHPLVLDVTNPDSVAEAARQVRDAVGEAGLWGLVNNAGICVSAPLECVPPEQLRKQLDTNVVGQVTTIQKFLPLLRTGRGRIVNVTSGLGEVAIPYLGAYAAAQFAKEAVSDALRRELRPFGITVCVVQPGAIMTPIWEKVATTAEAALGWADESVAALYRERFTRFLQLNVEGARISPTRPHDLSRTVVRALTEVRPRTRYRVGRDAQTASVLSRLLPDTALDARFRAVVGPSHPVKPQEMSA
jgi:NAD(P)-dependent dehydrogenase (short-subunit alcohol dehydrogenase family)